MDDTALNIRPWVADTIHRDPPQDVLGRSIPRRIGAFGFLRAIPGLVQQFQPIPDGFWALDTTGDGFSVAVVACPCGGEPRIEIGTFDGCACERVFLFTGRDVRVANSPKDRRAEVPRWQRIARAHLADNAANPPV